MMFSGKKSEFVNVASVNINGEYITVPLAVANRIQELSHENSNLKHKISNLKYELESIKPIIATKDLKPAISRDCINCKFVVKSPWNGAILGCRKDIVCEDFVPKGEVKNE